MICPRRISASNRHSVKTTPALDPVGETEPLPATRRICERTIDPRLTIPNDATSRAVARTRTFEVRQPTDARQLM
jgi:hypothetical protein